MSGTTAPPKDAATCSLANGGSPITSVSISGTTPATAMLVVQTVPARTQSTQSLKDLLFGGGGISLAGLLFLGFRFRRRDWSMILGLVILTAACGLAIGCGSKAADP
jgi:hypothetical protein